jgi:hypothetical protein
MLHVFYRISDAGPNWYTVRPNGFDKRKVFENFLSGFKNSEIHVICDNIRTDTVQWLKERVKDVDVLKYMDGEHVNATSELACNSFVYMIKKAKDTVKPGDYVYFLEDDYIHLPGSEELISEGLKVGDYVSLYDTPHDYMKTRNGSQQAFHEMLALGSPQGANVPFVCEPFKTELFRTNSVHWRKNESTTYTFAIKQQTLVDDFNELIQEGAKGDAQVSEAIRKKNRLILLSVPGHSSHIQIPWITPNRRIYEDLVKVLES